MSTCEKLDENRWLGLGMPAVIPTFAMAFADDHDETIHTGTLLKDPGDDANANAPYVPVITSNLGRTGDLQIYNWDGSNQPYVPWSGNKDD